MLRKKDILFVDGYNMIGAWPHLEKLMKQDELELARDQLLFELANFKKVRGYHQIIVVFDAYLVPGITKRFTEFDLQVVFTKENETADSYIEREVANYISPIYRVVVATSDYAEQWLIFQRGALRQSANELALEIRYAKQQVRTEVEHYYNQMLRRHSPWHVNQLIALDELRQEIEKNQ
ncbi:NYN domain-containing protein [Aerococcaceae bacterium zg-ZJ1578]|uniref:NYN domain-containing protein n=1 Tax=Aerococcaceae TaxID=186827 RepID=UPI0013BB3DDA|nr:MULTISPECIES: NYN domain-containing protein [unclassified Facklamia]MBK0347979.1 NYN domain-containing protein [Aerococcaceae bacterium zg-1578]MBR7927798.1 NYN domain-containing protein [Aerococcaceae bacterium zg-ZUI334]MBS4462876.1 NYN domain-containing protein [Aerococcaceae bacterium zg-B36]QQD65596.1 NYN domain-containing protein [Aerococcaceae bacterium zg-252]NEW64999.1 NYN domain-containing protein [Facklamia sp. 252]